MDKYQNIQKKTKLSLTLSTILVLIAIIIGVYNLIKAFSSTKFAVSVINSICNLVLCVLVSYYAIEGYKKPHGNLLREIFVAYGISVVIETTFAAASSSMLMILNKILWYLTALIIVYVAGRLDKIEKNKKLLLLATILQIVRCVLQFINGNPSVYSILAKIDVLILMFALCSAYFARYEEHKAAGLEDK